jgi:hypothetical protein
MKYLKRFNESIEDIDSICRKYRITNYTINQDGSVDVDGDVYLSYKKLTRLPLKFGKVGGGFFCYNNKLTTLEGCPKTVGGSFWCYNNQLTTLEGGPTEVVGGSFYCYNNQLTTLEGGPTKVGGDFSCSNNQLTTLEVCPKTVGCDFSCYNNQLTIINWDDVYTLNPISFNLESNPIFEVYRIFPDFKTFKDSLEWNYFKEPNIIIKERFVEACEILSEETGKTISIPEKIEGYIFESIKDDLGISENNSRY